MNIGVYGLGYVGTVTAACLAHKGHRVTGVDINAEKVRSVQAGRPPVSEPGLDSLLSRGVESGALEATTHTTDAAQRTSLSLITVGTPPLPGGKPDLSCVSSVCREIARARASMAEDHVVAIRSTVPRGTLAACRTDMKCESGDAPIHIAQNPEFLREGSSIDDFMTPPFTLVGTHDPLAEAALRELYEFLDAPFLVVDPDVAALVKLACNAWHATKVTFANEIGRTCAGMGIDGRTVMDILTRDPKLNTSAAYLRPGFAYGGSCLPKDVAALVSLADEENVPVPLLRALPESNRRQVDAAAERILALGARHIAVFGLSFKPDTDDLRESPTVPLVKRLLGEGLDVRIFDPYVRRGELLGANLRHVHEHLPHFEALMQDDPATACAGADLIVVTHGADTFREALDTLSPRVGRVLDLAGLACTPPPGVEYHGLSW